MDQTEIKQTATNTPNRALWLLLVLAIAGWFGYLAFFAPSFQQPAFDVQKAGSSSAARAQFDWNLLDLDGNPVTLADYQGKTVFLNLWATWCGPCVMEMPSIEELAANQELRDKGVVVLAVATGGEDAATVKNFVEAKGYRQITFLRSEVAPPEVFLTQGIPATFLISPDGTIAASQIGATEWNTPKVVDFLARLSRTQAIAVD